MPRTSDTPGPSPLGRKGQPAGEEELESSAAESLVGALKQLKAHGCVAFPTETVWGLAASAFSSNAVDRLRAWKGREENQPISLLVPGPEGLAEMGFEVSSKALRLIDEFWPGPLTLVLACTHTFPGGIARSDGAVGLRCSPHPVAGRLCQAAHDLGLGPLTATSLNRTGDPAARNEAEARKLCGTGLDEPYLLGSQGEGTEAGSPSTVLDLSGSEPEILRTGAIPAEKLYSSLALSFPQTTGTSPPGEQQE
ncbi:MAG: threonylcarbamoyl-AMP synthase [Spirochaeta sp.]|nr:threonylcarbamoyl-AMP synthase [Spirochaeta sp.]RPG04134.1 MAG: threonylcarbamoyl-AMP synthase [Proteobacteria bacterium TMED72]